MVLKKKTIIIITLVVLIVAAGYISNRYGKVIKVDNYKDKESQGETIIDETNDSSNNDTDNVASCFVDIRISKENQRTVNRQNLMEIIDSKNTSQDAKKKAEDNYSKLVDSSEKEMIIESLIKSRGFEDALVLLSDTSANVTVKAKELKADEVDFIKNIVCREAMVAASKITVQYRE